MPRATSLFGGAAAAERRYVGRAACSVVIVSFWIHLGCIAIVTSGAVALHGCVRSPAPPPTPCPSPRASSPSHVAKVQAPSPTVPPVPAPTPAPDSARQRNLSLLIGDHRLEIFEDGGGGDILLNGKVIIHRDLNDGLPAPGPWADLYRYFGPVPPYAGVVLLAWRAAGNACFGSNGLTFLGIRDDGTWGRADVPYCAGPEPVITWTPASVTVRIPSHPPNRGTGILPGETWLYTKGAVTKVRDN